MWPVSALKHAPTKRRNVRPCSEPGQARDFFDQQNRADAWPLGSEAGLGETTCFCVAVHALGTGKRGV